MYKQKTQFLAKKMFLAIIIGLILSPVFASCVSAVVVPTQPTLVSIAITTSANKLSYTIGDALNTTGMVVTGTYAYISQDGELPAGTQVVPFLVTNFDSSVANPSETLTVTATDPNDSTNQKTTTYTVAINNLQPTLISIAITTPANKLSYTVGDALNTTGMVVTGTYAYISQDGELPAGTQVIPSNQVTVTGFNSSTANASEKLTVGVTGQTPTTTYNIAINNQNSGGGGGGGTIAPTSCELGDINCDGKIDLLDLSIMMDQWDKTGANLSADLNNDKTIDALDLSVLMANWS